MMNVEDCHSTRESNISERTHIHYSYNYKKRKNSSGTITEQDIDQDQSSESMNTAKPVLRQMNM